MEDKDKENNLNAINTTKLITEQMWGIKLASSNSKCGVSKPPKSNPNPAQNNFPPPMNHAPGANRSQFQPSAHPPPPPPPLTHPSMIASRPPSTAPKQPHQTRPKAQPQPHRIAQHHYGRHDRPIGKHTTNRRNKPYRYKYNHYVRCNNNVRTMVIMDQNGGSGGNISAVDRAVVCCDDNIRFIIADKSGCCRKRFFDSHSDTYHGGAEFRYEAFGMEFYSQNKDDLDLFKGILSERAKRQKKQDIFRMLSACDDDHKSDGEEDDDLDMSGAMTLG
eukprot:184144_1